MTEVNQLMQDLTARNSHTVESGDSYELEEEYKKNYDYESKDRDTWGSKTEFLLSCMGYAIGLGNVWRFPYLCYRSGGGAFLIPYLLMLSLCGIPLYLLEMAIGQFRSVGCIGVFQMAPLLKGTGYAILVINFICACYCAVILSYPLLFIRKSFASNLPWISCNNSWNTAECVKIHELTPLNFTSGKVFNLAADEFFHNEILQISDGIEELDGIVWPLLWCLIVTCVVLYFCIFNGVKSVGKVVYFSATFPFFVLIVLFVRGITLPGAMKGIMFYMKPNWNSLLDLNVWTNAALQIFFSLGPGWGGIVNMASFNSFRNNIKVDVFLIPIVCCVTSIFAGFVVFSVLGYLSHKTGIPVELVATNGPGLVFVTYPEAIAMLPLPQVWAILFFSMLFLLGLDTVFVQVETIVTGILDEMPGLKKHSFKMPIIVCLGIFLGAIIMVTRGGMFILHLLDSYSSAIPLICICILETLMVTWIYGINNFLSDITFMTKKRPAFMWKYSLKFVLPLILIFLLLTSIFYNGNITYNGYVYPDWAIAIGWISCVSSIICIPLYMIYSILTGNGHFAQRIQRFLKPVDWKPANPSYHSEYESYKVARSHMTK